MKSYLLLILTISLVNSSKQIINEEDYDDDDFKKKWIELAPIVEFLEIKYVSPLEAYFGNTWKRVFKIWFHDNFGLPVKTLV